LGTKERASSRTSPNCFFNKETGRKEQKKNKKRRRMKDEKKDFRDEI